MILIESGVIIEFWLVLQKFFLLIRLNVFRIFYRILPQMPNANNRPNFLGLKAFLSVRIP